jgi:glutamyl-tRNA synthetase
VRGTIEFDASEQDDPVILKSDGFPTYHLAAMVDDHFMRVTTVVRGEEWISSTPKHLLLYRWLGFDMPAFAHMPLLRNKDKSKISKRKNPAARLTWFVEQGYLPEALVNFLALLGYGQPGESEIFTFDEFSASFDWTRVNTVGPVFDLDKLNWLNGHYLRALDDDELARRLVAHADQFGLHADADVITAAAPLVKERVETLAQGIDMLHFLLVPDGEFALDETAATKHLTPDGKAVLAAATSAVERLTEWTAASIEHALKAALVDGLGLKPRIAFAPVRVAVTGRTVSPPLFESMEILGRERSLRRLNAAVG